MTWPLVNEFRGVSSRNKTDISLASSFGSNSDSMATAFNNHFTQFSCSQRFTNSVQRSLDSSTLESAHLPLMSRDDLHTIVFSFKKHKSPGFDGIKLNDLEDVLQRSRNSNPLHIKQHFRIQCFSRWYEDKSSQASSQGKEVQQYLQLSSYFH